MYFYSIIYAVVCSLIIFGVLNWAFADYMETLKFQLVKNPNVCIMSPSEELEPRFYPDIYDATKSAIMEWETKLNEKGDWSFPIYEYTWDLHDNKVPRDFPDCNVFITFEKMIDGKSLGTAGLDFSHSTHKFTYITISLWHYPQTSFKIIIGDTPKTEVYEFEPKPLPISDIRNIVLHEFGHSLGLEHYYIVDRDCPNNSCSERSIMHPTLETFANVTKTVTSEDIQMVYELHGDDGFGYPNPPYVPYFCTFVNGTIGVCE